MPYAFNWAVHPPLVKETEYGVGQMLIFPSLNSCVGLLARGEDRMLGIHLVAQDRDASKFDQAAANQVLDLIKRELKVPQAVVMCGWADDWRSQEARSPETVAAFKLLEDELGKFWGDTPSGYPPLTDFGMARQFRVHGAWCRATLVSEATEPDDTTRFSASQGQMSRTTLFGMELEYFDRGWVKDGASWVKLT